MKKRKLTHYLMSQRKIFMWVNKHCSSFYMLVRMLRTMWGFYKTKKLTLNIIFTIFKWESWFEHLKEFLI